MNAMPVAGVVLLVLLVVGVIAGRARGRWTLLVAGIVALAVTGALVSGVTAPGARAPAWTLLLSTTVPLLVAFITGWLVARGSLLRRLVVLAVAALLLVALPYPALGAAMARL